MPRIVAALAVFVAVLCLTTTGWANPRRIAVLQPDDELLRAIALALSPWGLETIRSDAPLPEASQPGAARVASRLARQLDVEAIVWMTRLERGSLLWVYDAGTGDVTTRFLTQSPPLDGAAAAAVALSVKTVLRASAVAPPDERFGSHPTAPTGDRLWAVEVGAGGRWIGTREVVFTGEVAGVLWLPAARRLGLSLELSSGPGLPISEPGFGGRLREFALGAAARFRLIRSASFSTVVALGAVGHATLLHGTLDANSREVDVTRVNGSIDFDTALNFRLSDAIYVGISGGVAYFPRYQRYLVGGDPIFSARRWTVDATGLCGVELF
jgi:hypothetical protein